MAKIQPVQSEVSLPGSLGQARANTNMYEPVAQGVQNVGQVLEKVGLEREKKEQMAIISEVKSQFRTMSLERMIADRENRQGKAALDADDNPGVYKQYDKDATKWVGELATKVSPRYRELANRELQGIADGYRSEAARYQAQQLQVFRENAIKSSVTTLTAQVNAQMEIPGTGMPEVDATIEEMRVDIQANSGGRDVTDIVQKQAQDMFAKAVLAKAETDPDMALEMVGAGDRYLDSNPELRKKLTDGVDKLRVEGGIERSIDAITAVHDLKDDFSGAMEAAAGIQDDDIRKGVEQELTYQKNRVNDVRREQQRDALTGIHDQIFLQGNPPSDRQIDARDDLDPGAKETAKAWAKQKLSGEDITTDRNVYYDMTNMIAYEPQKFVKLDLTDPKISGNLSNGDWERFAQEQKTMRAGKKSGRAQSIGTALSRAKIYLKEADVETGAKAKASDIQKSKLVQSELARWSGEFFDEHQAAPTEVDIDRKLNQLFRTITIEDGGFAYFDKEVPVIFVEYGDIPEGDRAKIEASLKAKGIEATETAVANVYRQFLIAQQPEE